jgi:hypothetical protein
MYLLALKIVISITKKENASQALWTQVMIYTGFPYRKLTHGVSIACRVAVEGKGHMISLNILG